MPKFMILGMGRVGRFSHQMHSHTSAESLQARLPFLCPPKYAPVSLISPYLVYVTDCLVELNVVQLAAQEVIVINILDLSCCLIHPA